MNGGYSQEQRVLASALAEHPSAFGPVRLFRAWKRTSDTKQPRPFLPIKISASSLEEACAQASIKVMHKDVLLVQEIDEARRINVVHVFLIQAGTPIWRKNPATGLSERHAPLKAKPLFAMPFDAFEPTRPFDALRDDPVGVDRGLIEETAP